MPSPSEPVRNLVHAVLPAVWVAVGLVVTCPAETDRHGCGQLSAWPTPRLPSYLAAGAGPAPCTLTGRIALP